MILFLIYHVGHCMKMGWKAAGVEAKYPHFKLLFDAGKR